MTTRHRIFLGVYVSAAGFLFGCIVGLIATVLYV